MSTTSVKSGVIDMLSILSGSFAHFRARSASITNLLFLISPMRNTSDFSKLIFRPDTSENSRNVCKIVLIDSSLNSVNSCVSSAYCNILYSLLPAWMLFIFILWYVCIARISAHKMKRYGDRGQPCRTPRPKLKYWAFYIGVAYLNPLFYIVWETKILQTFEYKWPFQFIKCFFKVYWYLENGDLLSLWCMMSKIVTIFCPMCRPFKNPVWSWSIIRSATSFAKIL